MAWKIVFKEHGITLSDSVDIYPEVARILMPAAASVLRTGLGSVGIDCSPRGSDCGPDWVERWLLLHVLLIKTTSEPATELLVGTVLDGDFLCLRDNQ